MILETKSTQNHNNFSIIRKESFSINLLRIFKNQTNEKLDWIPVWRTLYVRRPNSNIVFVLIFIFLTNFFSTFTDESESNFSGLNVVHK